MRREAQGEGGRTWNTQSAARRNTTGYSARNYCCTPRIPPVLSYSCAPRPAITDRSCSGRAADDEQLWWLHAGIWLGRGAGACYLWENIANFISGFCGERWVLMIGRGGKLGGSRWDEAWRSKYFKTVLLVGFARGLIILICFESEFLYHEFFIPPSELSFFVHFGNLDPLIFIRYFLHNNLYCPECELFC